MTDKAIIALEDGSLFEGRAFAGSGEIFGELVFNTSMSGYQEVLTDPSYHEQIVTFTYPLIGNYGINPEDVESQSVRPAGIVIGEYSRIPSNWRCRMTLKDYLEQSGRLGVHEVDTRAITLHIRSRGAMKCVISTTDLDRSSLVRKANDWPGFIGRDIASEVSTTQRYQWPGPHKDHQGFSSIGEDNLKAYDKYFGRTADAPRFRVAVLDCGLKANQLRLMARLGCELEVFPMGTPATSWQRSRTDSSSPTDRAIRQPCRMLFPISGKSRSPVFQRLESASDTSCSDKRSAARPTSSSSAIAAATSP
ncbi:MAG: Carbamoyl-phosphate synthase small chain [Verrucomicrobia bacterium ADurb.Bin345]|nr:MAG: Carbamoyl-phosphate synthase small chain [Verrucomicrobia bacterium ADurb.Bin345]